MSDILLLKIKDNNGEYTGNYKAYGINGAANCPNQSESLAMAKKSEDSEIILDGSIEFQIEYGLKFLETLKAWQTKGHYVKAVRIAIVNIKIDPSSKKEVPVISREIVLYNVSLMTRVHESNKTATLTFIPPRVNKYGNDLPGLMQTQFQEQEKASQRGDVIYVDLLSMKELSAADESWKDKEVEEMIK